MICDYCGAQAQLVGGDIIYPHRKDLYSLKFWKCPDCVDVYCGCHKFGARVGDVISDGTLPLGTLADATLRKARSKAHAVFDPLWRESDSLTRNQAYKQLSEYLNINKKDCHIAMFDEDTCRKVVCFTESKCK